MPVGRCTGFFTAEAQRINILILCVLCGEFLEIGKAIYGVL